MALSEPATSCNRSQPIRSTQPLPDLNAPAIYPAEPIASYKLPFRDPSGWLISTDGGASSQPTGTAAVAGSVVDLQLQISPARQHRRQNHRLRLAFMDTGGQLVELNLNAVSHAAGEASAITSPVRSLTGALLLISQAEDDMRAFCAGARFSIRRGRGRGVFLETDIAIDGRWLAMSGPAATLLSPTDPQAYSQQLTKLKARFRSLDLLLATPPVQRLGLTP